MSVYRYIHLSVHAQRLDYHVCIPVYRSVCPCTATAADIGDLAADAGGSHDDDDDDEVVVVKRPRMRMYADDVTPHQHAATRYLPHRIDDDSLA